jgi:hypothetical protein
MGQTGPSGQDAESDDVRVRAFADDRDRINALREGTERQPDVIRRVLDAYDEARGEAQFETAQSFSDVLGDDEVAIVGSESAVVDEIADRLSGEQAVTLEASERKAIAREVAEVLRE